MKKEREAKQLFDSSIDGIFIFNDKGYLCDMNPGAQDLSGLDESKNGLVYHFNNRIVRN
ncbi:PAS domain-containing protein (plasmid) [Alkalihalobacillus hwajinpoensis]|nr:PAS domain-containing protein [Pseudalkalibacillus hwajinpoensis]